MATQTQPKASERVVVLLRPKEKLRLEKLARTEQVSSGEIIRRSLISYGANGPSEEKKLFAEMNALLDKIRLSLQESRKKVDDTLKSIEARHQTPEYIERDKRLNALLAEALGAKTRKSKGTAA